MSLGSVLAGPLTAGKTLLVKCVEALFRVLALAFLVGLHRGLDWLAELSFQRDFPTAVWIVRVVFLAAFCVVYIHEAWEMVIVFVPRLGSESADRRVEVGGVKEGSDAVPTARRGDR